ncbi:glycoside hydrolase family 43 protein [Carboxylicivirga linearis]|uniref:Glycoside hydrolase family 43 protein n=1 Tax=Carboxylicivirga linearis TaxID=1628157 RepID=A0ABS5JYE4_9BACT|nr:glycoside hydrolase family 43 protein [Carboxylicivirga linearis]MBS2099326.1 glycoside hydrolase family 43 protein [Carboxylicivirga linearis]
MIKVSWFTLFILFVFVGCKTETARTYENPIIRGMNPDPSICRVGDDFYLVTSTFEYFPGIPIYHSKDLVNWKQIGHVLHRPENCLAEGAYSSGGNYAPAIRYNNGTFYVTCTNYGGKGSQGAYYVTATDPAGPWSDPVWVGNWNVDPSILFANDSMYWISPDNKGSFMVGTINPETGETITPLRLVASGQGGSSPEGPHMYKINDYYYLMSAEGGTGYEHREVIQRSKSPYGPFDPSPYGPVITNMNHPESPFQAIGHADLVQLPDDSWWLVCLGIRPQGGKFQHLGRETFLAPVTWTEDGWPIAGTNGMMDTSYVVPNLPEHKWEKAPVRDDFDAVTLGLDWTFIRQPYGNDWSLTGRKGYLRLNGSAITLKEMDSPAFVGRRQSALNIAASTKMSFTPTADNEEAGLVIRANDANHYALVVTQKDGKRVVKFRRVLEELLEDEIYTAIPDGDVVLRITATPLEYQFWVQAKGFETSLIASAPTKDLSTEKVGGFIGVFIGMYASGNGQANTNPADYEWFDFEINPVVPYVWNNDQE